MRSVYALILITVCGFLFATHAAFAYWDDPVEVVLNPTTLAADKSFFMWNTATCGGEEDRLNSHWCGDVTFDETADITNSRAGAGVWGGGVSIRSASISSGAWIGISFTSAITRTLNVGMLVTARGQMCSMPIGLPDIPIGKVVLPLSLISIPETCNTRIQLMWKNVTAASDWYFWEDNDESVSVSGPLTAWCRTLSGATDEYHFAGTMPVTANHEYILAVRVLTKAEGLLLMLPMTNDFISSTNYGVLAGTEHPADELHVRIAVSDSQFAPPM